MQPHCGTRSLLTSHLACSNITETTPSLMRQIHAPVTCFEVFFSKNQQNAIMTRRSCTASLQQLPLAAKDTTAAEFQHLQAVLMQGHFDASSMQNHAFQHSTVGPKPKRIRRCASTPTLSSCSSDLGNSGLEVYVAFRPFTEFGGALFAKLPPSVKDNLLGLGVAHYMTVFRTPDGRYTQFDFGPTGGRDIYVSAGSLDKLRALDQPKKSGTRSVPGEVRENQLTSLPPSFVYVGRSNLSLGDVRSFNRVQQTHYELHQNDCRHYVNNLVRYTTGIDRASTVFVQAAFKQKHTEPRWTNSIFTLGHYLTDVNNWPRVKAASQASVAAAAILTGRYTFARIPAGLPQALLPARNSLAIVPAAKARFVRKPVYVAATGAVATYAASLKQAPAFQEAVAVGSRLGEQFKSVARGAAAFGRQTAGGLQGRLALAGNSAAGAVASARAATRGAATSMQNRQQLHVQARPRRITLPLPRLRRKGQEQVMALV